MNHRCRYDQPRLFNLRLDLRKASLMVGKVKRQWVARMLETSVIGILVTALFCVMPEAQQLHGSSTSPTSKRHLVPIGLEASVKANFPAYRIPEDGDVTAGWVVDKGPGASPFFCLGDFNGDGMEDAAIILINAQKWLLVVFEQEQSGRYRPAFVARAKTKEELGKYWENEILVTPQQMLLRKVRNGETWAPEAGDDPDLGTLKIDAIEIMTKPRPNAYFASLLMWQKGKYHQVSGDPLVELSTQSR